MKRSGVSWHDRGIRWVIGIVVIGLVVQLALGAADDAEHSRRPPAESELIVRLQSGAVLRAKRDDNASIKFKSSFGEVALNLSKVQRIEFDKDSEKFRLHMINGSNISGTVLDKEMALQLTSGKNASVKWSDVASIATVAPDLELIAAMEQIEKLKFIHDPGVKKIPEAKIVLAGAVKRDKALRENAKRNAGRAPTHPPLLERVKSIRLMHVYDTTKEPMYKHSGKPQKVAGSYAPQALVGTAGGIMTFGPYVELPKGRYIAIYRIQYTQKPSGGNISNLEVCHNANGWKSLVPNADEVNGPGEWNELPVPFEAPKPMKFEFRCWPHGRQIAHDLIYLYKLD